MKRMQTEEEEKVLAHSGHQHSTEHFSLHTHNAYYY